MRRAFYYFLRFDAASEPDVEKVVNEAVQKYDRLDIFFANAGRSSGTLFTETRVDQFMDVLRVNTLRYTGVDLEML